MLTRKNIVVKTYFFAAKALSTFAPIANPIPPKKNVIKRTDSSLLSIPKKERIAVIITNTPQIMVLYPSSLLNIILLNNLMITTFQFSTPSYSFLFLFHFPLPLALT